MSVSSQILFRVALTSIVATGVMSAATGAVDLSKYRNFQLGSGLATVLKQAGSNASQVKVLHTRPALIQELEWRTESSGIATQIEPAKQIVFSFYKGDLFQVIVNYDHYDTEGLTGDDLVEAISSTYGLAVKPAASAKAATGRYGDEESVLAEWQDSAYCFYLLRSSYGPTFKLVGISKKLVAPAQAAILQAKHLDEADAPQREAQRIATEGETERVKLEKARLLNKRKFKL